MIIDARKLPINHTIQADVCIIGAEVAGITLAKELIRSIYMSYFSPVPALSCCTSVMTTTLITGETRWLLK